MRLIPCNSVLECLIQLMFLHVQDTSAATLSYRQEFEMNAVQKMVSEERSAVYRAVFKGGLRVKPPPPEILRRKFFGNVKKHAQRNASAHTLCVCTVVMPGKAIWRI